MSLRGLLAAAVSLAVFLTACADRNAGEEIPADQLYYPFGIQRLGVVRLAILSTNFDQRFRTAQLTLLDAAQLIDGILAARGLPPEMSCSAGNLPLYSQSLNLGGQAVLSRVKVPGIGTELLAVPVGTSTPTEHRLYMTDRLSGLLIYVLQDANDRLICSRQGEPRFNDSDCTPSHLTVTQAEEPGSLAYVRHPDGTNDVAVGHLFPYLLSLVRFGVVTYLDEAEILARAQGTGPLVSAAPYRFGARIDGAGGISGVAFTPVRPNGGGVLVLPLFSAPRLEFVSLELFQAGEGSEEEEETVVPVQGDSIRLEVFTNASGGRGLTLTEAGDRAVVSLRFAEPGVSFNSGVAVIRIEADRLTPSAVLEVGEELGPPALRPRLDPSTEPLLAYVGDLRLDKVWIVDVTREVPRLVGEILGRADRRLSDGRVIDARVLDGPTGFAFVRRNGRLYAFVTNFSGSTLSVLDVTDASPQRHCLIARIGRDVDANGESEVDRL